MMKLLRAKKRESKAKYVKVVNKDDAKFKFNKVKTNSKAKALLVKIALKAQKQRLKAKVKVVKARVKRANKKAKKTVALSDRWVYTKTLDRVMQRKATAGHQARKEKETEARAERHFAVAKALSKEKQVKLKTAKAFEKRTKKLANNRRSGEKATKEELKDASAKRCPCVPKGSCMCRDKRTKTCRKTDRKRGPYLAPDLVSCARRKPKVHISLGGAEFDKDLKFPKLIFRAPKFHAPKFHRPIDVTFTD